MSFKRKPVIIAVELFLAVLLPGAARAQNNVPNQQLADEVARVLQVSGKLKNYHVDIQAAAGVVELKGKVANVAQREAAVSLARSVPGVRQVHDRLLAVNDRAIVPVQAKEEVKEDEQPEVMPAPRKVDPQPVLPPATIGGTNAPGASCPFEPMPFNMNAPNDIYMKPPPLPPYAWPTYAPYNNYSRVAYPTLYPADAWPGIGPFYPYPKVPLGWRSVTLTWNDGYWWYGKGVTGHDWWRIRYK